MSKPAEKIDQRAVTDIETNQALAKKLESKRNTIKNTVAKDATDDELDMFMHLAKEYNLDPFQGEIYFWKFGDKDPTIMTSRDGYLKIANQHPAFDGMDSGVIYPGDDFKKTQDGVEHSLDISNMSKQPQGAYAVVYRTDREVPIRVIIPFSDYNKNNKVWNNYPSAMIQKCAESMALKRAFSVSGLVSKEEMGYEQDNQTTQQFDGGKQSVSTDDEKQGVIGTINTLLDECDYIGQDNLYFLLKASYNNRELNQLSVDELREVKDKLSEKNEKLAIMYQIKNKVDDDTDLLDKEVVEDQLNNIAGVSDLKEMKSLSLNELQNLKDVCVTREAKDAKDVEVVNEDNDIAAEVDEALDID